MTEFEGKVSLITGGTSGIGAGCARAFAKAGASVMLTGRHEGRGAELVEALTRDGARAEFMAGDITDAAFCDRLVERTVADFGRLDVLVNSAGVFYLGTTVDTTDELWHETMAVNVNGTFFMSRAAIPAMKQTGRGAIVNLSSDYGLVAGKGFFAYCASKGAVMQMTRAMAIDHADDGIRVNAVCPGALPTPMMVRSLESRGYTLESGAEMISQATPISRLATVEEVANATLFLASPAQGYITGAALPIDGGNTAR